MGWPLNLVHSATGYGEHPHEPQVHQDERVL